MDTRELSISAVVAVGNLTASALSDRFHSEAKVLVRFDRTTEQINDRLPQKRDTEASMLPQRDLAHGVWSPRGTVGVDGSWDDGHSTGDRSVRDQRNQSHYIVGVSSRSRGSSDCLLQNRPSVSMSPGLENSHPLPGLHSSPFAPRHEWPISSGQRESRRARHSFNLCPDCDIR